MLPRVLVQFLDRASVAALATRDSACAPRVHMVTAWKMESEGILLCGVPGAFTAGLLESLAGNGQVALTAELVGPHETYQYKGRYLDSRPAGPADLQLAAACRQRYVDTIFRSYPGAFTREALARHFPEPERMLRFEVREIFLQTPGPAAGQRLVPRWDTA